MTFNRNQVAEILIPASAKGKKDGSNGTGYLLFAHCLLTAFHVVQNCGGRPIWARLLGNYAEHPETWLSTDLLWHNERFDLALLHYPGNYNQDIVIPQIKVLNRNEGHKCRLYGFPAFNVLPSESDNRLVFDAADSGTAKDLDVLEGWIKPLVSKISEHLFIENDGASPWSMDDWKGISGGPVFAGDYLVGVARRGLEKLRGQRLEAIALDDVDVLKALNAALGKHFRQPLSCVDVDRVKAREIYRNRQEQRVLRAKTIAATFDEDLYSLKEISVNDDIDISTLPEKRLEDLLVTISEWNREIVLKAWRCLSASLPFNVKMGAFFEINLLYDIVTLSNFTNAKKQFFTEIDRQLIQLDQHDYSNQLRELTETVFKLDIRGSVANVSSLETGQKESIENVQSILLVKIKIIQRLENSLILSVVPWFISNSQGYQERCEKPENQIRNHENYARELFKSVDNSQELVGDDELLWDKEPSWDKIKVEFDEDSKQDVIRDQISKIVNELWEEYCELEELQPEVKFYVSRELLGIDFQNIKLNDNDSLLGWILPVSVSCLERYEETNKTRRAMNNMKKLRQRWIKRWSVLGNFAAEPVLSHLFCLDGTNQGNIDMTCSRTFAGLLSQQDRQRESLSALKQTAGVGFWLYHEEFSTILGNLLKHGLPIVFWPSRCLERDEAEGFQNCLNVASSEMLLSVMQYRNRCVPTDAGCFSLWIDHPYFYPPDCDVPDFQ
ncbi:MAG: trypsin-like peptidase domain-containing protein [Symploca sp. SIO2B6]|nr:trypsin-like peptidase domain-containing protein [Symploca sp. SIO2B6]